MCYSVWFIEFSSFFTLNKQETVCFLFLKRKNATKSQMSKTRVKFSHLITVDGF